MGLRDRVLTRVAKETNTSGSEVRVNLDDLLRRLLLFDEVIIHSIRLEEIPQLVEALGVGGVQHLLDEGAFSIRCYASSIGQLGQASFSDVRMQKGLLPLYGYSFSPVHIAEGWEEFARSCWSRLRWPSHVSKGDIAELESSVQQRLVPVHSGEGQSAVAALEAELRSNAPVVHDAVVMTLTRRFREPVDRSAFRFTVHEIAEGDFTVETDIHRVFALTRREAHSLVERALLAASTVELQLEQMERHMAVVTNSDEDLPLLRSKFSFLLREVAASVVEDQFDRVIELGELPRLSPDSRIDVDRFLKVRESAECRTFRHWVRDAAAMPDTEIVSAITDVRQKLASLYNSGTGEAVRFLVTTGAGFIPVVGGVVSTGLGALDTFVIEKVLRESGPISFLTELYPSVFEEVERRG